MVRGRLKRKKTASFDPLVLNLKGMKSLGVVDGVMEPEDFSKNYIPIQEQQPKYANAVSAAEFRQKFEKYVTYSKTDQNLVGYIHIGNERAN